MRLARTCWVVATAVLLLGSNAKASPYPIHEILEKSAADKLGEAEVKTSNDLLEKGASPKGLRALAKKTGLPVTQLASWVKMCDLLRLKGVGPEMVRLLNAAKVTTVKQLREQDPSKLHKAIMAANEKGKITEKPPEESQIVHWIGQAKKLKDVIR